MKELEDLVIRILKRLSPKQSFTGTVTAVDKASFSCTVKKAEGLELYKVRLNSIVKDTDTRITAFPAVGSLVICQLIDNNKTSAYISKLSEVESIEIVLGDDTKISAKNNQVKIDCPEIIINEGDNDGLVKIQPLVDKINALEEKHNAFVATYNLHTHPVPLPTPATPTASLVPTSLSTDVIPSPTMQIELENTKVKH